MKKILFTIMFNLIFAVYVIGIIFLHYYIGLAIIPGRVLTYGGLLFLIGICLSSENKKIKIIGLIIIVINFIYIMLIGYYDYLISPKLSNLKNEFCIASVITIYYLLIYFLNNVLIKRKEK